LTYFKKIFIEFKNNTRTSALQSALSAIKLKHKEINNFNMGYIYSANSQKIGHVEETGDVYDLNGHHLGKITPDGHIMDLSGQLAGHIDGSGRVYEQGKNVGIVHSDGSIFDLNGHRLGHSDPPHVEFGGAAMLVLIR
jgi:hypothetical protein